MLVTAGLLVAGIGSMALILRELRKAPEGYEDEHGFRVVLQESGRVGCPRIGDNEELRTRSSRHRLMPHAPAH